MPARNQEQTTEMAISVSEMARRLTLSRGRFYELVREGVFPAPCYCLHTRRALYPADLVQQCLLIRQTNMGANDRYVLFYRHRSAAPAAVQPRSRPLRSVQGSNRLPDPALVSLREGLASLGMNAVADDRIRSALASAFPFGTNGIDAGAVLASVVRLIRSPNGARTSSTS